ncbi:hypothetical protein OAM25_01965 [Gammaproteobacteria bacterium]|nr:hypothetical protein [Gammaproteobacteria bacterium]
MNFYIPDFMIYVIAIIAMVFVIIKLKKLENKRLSAIKEADRQMEGDKNV